MLPTTLWTAADSPNLPYADLRSKMDTMAPRILLTDQNWNPYDNQDGVELFTQFPESEPVQWVKGVTTFETDIETSRGLMSGLESRSKWDSNFKSGSVVHWYDPNNFITLTEFYAPWPFSCREFLAYTHLFTIEHPTRPGVPTLIFWASSVDLDGFPPKDDPVRGHVYFLCYSLTVNETNPQHTDVAYCIAQSPRGNIPDSVVAGVNAKLPLVLGTINTMIKNDPKTINAIADEFVVYFNKAVEAHKAKQIQKDVIETEGVVSTIE